MELKLFKKDNEYWTRIKIPKKELNSVPAAALKILEFKPTKISDRFTYYELKGDYLNGKF